MGRELLLSDAELYRRVDEVMHYIWDPIGVAGAPEARDEYQSYLPGLFDRVQKGNLPELVDYMGRIATERMGLGFDRAQAEHAAKLMLHWKEVIEAST